MLKRVFFENPNIQNRAKTSFYFLKMLANCLRIIPNKKKKFTFNKQETLGFSKVKNIMLIKENIDETKLKVVADNKPLSDRRYSLVQVQNSRKVSVVNHIPKSMDLRQNENLLMPTFRTQKSKEEDKLILLKRCLDGNKSQFSSNSTNDVTRETTNIYNKSCELKERKLDLYPQSSSEDFKINLHYC